MMDAKLLTVRTAYGISSYIDQTGAVKQQDDDQQADICELIRAGLFYDKFGPL